MNKCNIPDPGEKDDERNGIKIFHLKTKRFRLPVIHIKKWNGDSKAVDGEIPGAECVSGVSKAEETGR